MQSLAFWKNWHFQYKSILFLLIAVMAVSVLYMWAMYFGEPGIAWEKLQEQEEVETIVHQFQLGPFELDVPAEVYVIMEYFDGSDFTPNDTASYFFLAICMFSIAVLLAIVSTLERFWFYAGMTLFILLMISLKLEVLELFGHRDYIPTAVAMALFGGVAFYFHAFRSDVGFGLRLLAFVILEIVAALIITYFSGVEYPMLHLSVTAYIPALVITIIFILVIAHEIMIGFVYIAGQNSKTSIRDFFIIAVIWLVNLVITYLHEVGILDWNFLYLNPFLVMMVSALMGLWGFKHREPLYGNIFSFSPTGAYFYLAMGAIAFSFVTYATGNANDAVVKVIRDTIIFSHLAFGLIFLIYFLSNFLGLVESNFSAYKVIYKPTRMPYFTFRLAGVIVTIAFVAYSGTREFIYHGTAGFFDSMADLYSHLEAENIAESYYRQSSRYSYGDHHANYILGKLDTYELNFKDAQDKYFLASAKRPSDYSLINGANVFIREGETEKAIQAYQRLSGRVRHKEILYNNLGYALSKTGRQDSAIYFLNEARHDKFTSSSAEANFFAYVTLKDIPLSADSIIRVFDSTASSTVANAIALSSLQRQPLTLKIDPLKNVKLDLYSATLLNNYLIKYAHSLDTTFTSAASKIVTDSLNANFYEALSFSLAFAYYHQGNVTKALSLLAELSFITGEQQGKYNYIQGLWALEQGSPKDAADYFTAAISFNYKKAGLYRAIALTESRQIPDALEAWNELLQTGRDAEKIIARSVIQVLTLPVARSSSLSDVGRYQFCRYRISVNDTILFNQLVNGFTNANYKAQAILDMSKKLFKAGGVEPAIRYFNRISGIEITSRRTVSEARFFELEMLASRGETFQIATQINKGVTFDNAHTLEKLLYAAMVYEASGDSVSAAKNYAVVGTHNPFFEEGIIAAADFFSKQDAKSYQSYDMLAKAIQLNPSSIKLLSAYVREALRMGFDEYALSAGQRLNALIDQQH